MEEYKVTMHNEEDTVYLAQNIESEKFPNMVICLKGDLGSGKTIFTKGFAQALEVKDMVLEATKITETDYENRKGCLSFRWKCRRSWNRRVLYKRRNNYN